MLRVFRCPAVVYCMLALVCLVTLSPIGSSQHFPLDAKSAVLMDYRSGRVLYAFNEFEPLPIASVTKIMTLTLLLEAVEDGILSLDEFVTTSQYAASMGGTQVWLRSREMLPLREMLYAIAVGSANDAAIATAEHLSGSVERFVQNMNQRANTLGLTNTVYANPTGLSPENPNTQVMSAMDVALLSRHAIDVPLMMDFVSTYGYTMRADSTAVPQLWNYNRLLRRYSGVDGLKTGYTRAAGYCLAATAERDHRLIAVVLGCRTDASRERDIRTLLDYGFNSYNDVEVLAENTVVYELHFPHGSPSHVPVVVQDPLLVLSNRDEQLRIETEIRVEHELTLPLMAGEPAGTVTAYIDGHVAGQSQLVLENSVENAGIFTLAWRFLQDMVDIFLGGI